MSIVGKVGRWVGTNPGNRFVAPAVKGVGSALAQTGAEIGKDAWKAVKFVHRNRNTKGFHLATAGVAAVAITGIPSNNMTNPQGGMADTLALRSTFTGAYEAGKLESKIKRTNEQIASNMSISNDGGGTFLRPNYTPNVPDNGATGDLVFALRSLRNGG